MQQDSQRIIRPDEVKTMDTHAERKPDRYFYILYAPDDTVWECDGYLAPQIVGEEPEWMILLTCPVCRKELAIKSKKKKMLIDEKGLHLDEPIACSYPGEFSAPCKFQVALEPPSKQEDKIATVPGPAGARKVKIDAVARRV